MIKRDKDESGILRITILHTTWAGGWLLFQTELYIHKLYTVTLSTCLLTLLLIFLSFVLPYHTYLKLILAFRFKKNCSLH